MVSKSGRPKKETWAIEIDKRKGQKKVISCAQFTIWDLGSRYSAISASAVISYKYLGSVIREVIKRFNPSPSEVIRLQAIWEQHKRKKR